MVILGPGVNALEPHGSIETLRVEGGAAPPEQKIEEPSYSYTAIRAIRQRSCP